MILPQGLDVGDHAPDFILPTSQGKDVILSQLLAKHGTVILTFYHQAFTNG